MNPLLTTSTSGTADTPQTGADLYTSGAAGLSSADSANVIEDESDSCAPEAGYASHNSWFEIRDEELAYRIEQDATALIDDMHELPDLMALGQLSRSVLLLLTELQNQMAQAPSCLWDGRYDHRALYPNGF